MSRGKKILEQLKILEQSVCSSSSNQRTISTNIGSYSTVSFQGYEKSTTRPLEITDSSSIAPEKIDRSYSSNMQINAGEKNDNVMAIENVPNSSVQETLTMSNLYKVNLMPSYHNTKVGEDCQLPYYVSAISARNLSKTLHNHGEPGSETDEPDSSDHSEYIPDTDEFSEDSGCDAKYSSIPTNRSIYNLQVDTQVSTQNLGNIGIISNETPKRVERDNDLNDNIRVEHININSTTEIKKLPEVTATELEETVFFHTSNTLTKHDNDSHNSPETQNKKKTWKKVERFPDYCYYCESSVLNFGRHLFRNHSSEPEVMRISTLKPNDLSRKRLIAAIRKRGNHLKNLDTCVKPVKKSHVPGRNESECLPCKHCLGYFRPKQLWRHIKKCPQNPGEKTKFSHKSDAQDILIRYLPIDQKLRETVFPRMLPDKVSLVVKRDLLICKYGAQYLTSHREKHHINVCSRKMRELAKILIEIRKLHPTIKHFYDALQPIYFDSFVEATKIVAGYDASKEEYASSTFAMNIATSLKECCSLAIRMTLKRRSNNSNVDTAELEANFKTFQQLLTDSWKFEVSSVAASCLNARKWNKITIVPLASDLKIFRNYLLERAKQAQLDLKTNPKNEKAYKLLLEVSYCRSMLLNRKRGGELQRMPLQLYQSAPMHQTYEEFNDAISQTEKILLKHFKRVVTRGKRDRGVPVLFSTDVQQHIEVLIKLRNNFVKESNTYLFPKLLHDSPITGYKVMKKHAKLSGAKNPEAITSTKLRKHLATMSQIFELSPNEIEQLATFMGHTKDIHNKVYRLPDDIFQTAKIAKLLILMESGKAGEYKGKSLDEIELDLEENVCEDTSDEEVTEILEQQTPSTSNAASKKKRKLVAWNTDQKELAKLYFKDHIQNKVPPKKGECENLKANHPGVYENKTWQQIKVFIQNVYRKQ